MTKLPLILLLAGAGLLQGCSAFDKHHGVNWGEGTCPTPAPEAISKSKQLIIEDGKTLKCQIRPYVSNMACQGITDNSCRWRRLPERIRAVNFVYLRR